MKYVLLFLFGLLIFTAFSFTKTSEAFTVQSFGGRVVAAPIVNTICPSILGGAIAIQPVGIFPPGPYDISTATLQKKVTVGGWMLGRYNTVMSPTTCQITTPSGPVPLPTFPILMYGASSSFK